MDTDTLGPGNNSILYPVCPNFMDLIWTSAKLGPLKFISLKGTLIPIDIGIRTIYGLKSGLLKFISLIGT